MLKVILNEKDSTVILEPDGALSEEDFVEASRSIDPLISKVKKLNGIIIYSRSFPGWNSFSALIKHLKFINSHHKKVRKLAFVSDSIMGSLAEHIGEHFVSAEVKNFAYDELADAKEWILKTDIDYQQHGISIGIQRVEKQIFMTLKATGRLTHSDYEKITPMIDSALQSVEDPEVKMLIDASEFEGWEARAAWDDFKIGLKHGSDFDKIAIYGDSRLLSIGASISSWFMDAEVKEFDSLNRAIEWLRQDRSSMDIVQREIYRREDDIRDSIVKLFEKQIKITDLDVAEADDQEAAELLIEIFSKKLDELKADVKDGKYRDF